MKKHVEHQQLAQGDDIVSHTFMFGNGKENIRKILVFNCSSVQSDNIIGNN